MLGMYVHTHWGYHHPYAARSWTLADWRGYLSGLKALGYDLVMFWPLLDSMPVQPTPGDQAFLGKIAQVIDMAHDEFGLKFLITVCPNVTGNAHAAQYAYEERPYFVCERKINPQDPAQVAELAAARRWQFETLRSADGVVIIDSDPGGYIGSVDTDFVNLVKCQVDIFREYNPSVEFIYWMLIGWENYNRFWAETRQASAEPQLHLDVETFEGVLKGIASEIAEPWWLFSSWPQHLEAIHKLGLDSKSLYFPYGVIEGEPTFPFTNWTPREMRSAFERFPAGTFPLGVMANSQTHCLQLPHAYLFSRYALEGPDCSIDLAGFGDGLLPGLGGKLSAAWEAIGSGSANLQRQMANIIGDEFGQPQLAGPLSGLLLGDADRFLLDLAMNLELRAALADLEQAVNGPSSEAKHAVQGVLDILYPYQQRLGFLDAYVGPMHDLLNDPLSRLGDPGINQVLAQFHDWRDISIRNGVVPRLMDAMETYIRDEQLG